MVIVYPSVSNLKSPNIVGTINAFLIDHASYRKNTKNVKIEDYKIWQKLVAVIQIFTSK